MENIIIKERWEVPLILELSVKESSLGDKSGSDASGYTTTS